MFEHTSSQESVKMYIFVIKTSKVVKKMYHIYHRE